ncbi:CaMKII, partial [Symbiodinium sp. KB8]
MAAYVPKDPGFLVGRYGTAPYMSPEMAKATAHSLSTDVWSLAATLYVILFGEFLYMPAEPHNPKAMRACIIHDYPRPKFQRRKDMVGEVVIREAATLTAKLLERCPRARCTATEALK